MLGRDQKITGFVLCCVFPTSQDAASWKRIDEWREAEQEPIAGAAKRARGARATGGGQAACDKYVDMAVFAVQMSLDSDSALRKFMLEHESLETAKCHPPALHGGPRCVSDGAQLCADPSGRDARVDAGC
jgi:hypothetical protein